MNKDMINIDDFVREKLGGQEERRDPAAWLKMKELLDKEMPERAVPLWFRLGKPAVFVGAALLLALLSVGGYKIMTLNSTKQNIDTVNINKPKQSNNNNSKKSAATINPTNQGDKNIQTAEEHQSTNKADITHNAEHQTAKNNIVGTTPNNTHQLNTAATAISSTHKNVTTANQITKGSIAANSTPANNTNNNANGTLTPKFLTKQHVSGHRNRKNDDALAKAQTSNADQGKATSSAQKIFAANNPTQKTIVTTAPNHTTTKENKLTQTNNIKKQKLALAASGSSNTGNKQTIATAKTAKQTPKATTTKKAKVSNDVAKNKVANQPINTTKNQDVDSINTLTVVEHPETSKGVPRKTIYKTDTVSVGKTTIAKKEQLPATPEETTTATTSRKQRKSTLRKIAAENKKAAVLAASTNPTKTEPNLTAANKNNSSNSENVTNLNKKKQKKNSGLSFISKDKVNEVVDNIKYDLGHALFYFGATAGGNYSLSKTNSFTGMQFGFTGEIVFNKHLSLMGELKYFNRSGNRKTVNDDYTNVTVADSIAGGNKYYTMITDSTHHYYNFSTLHSFELPVTLRYAINKFYLMTGINLAYYLTVNAEEVNTYYPQASSRTSGPLPITSGPPSYVNMTKQVNIQDFSSKFGIGYIFGIGYQVAPAFQVDLRITKTFWDNSSTDGGKHLSKDFYQIPSMQLSIGYQFNRGKSKPTFGPTSGQ